MRAGAPIGVVGNRRIWAPVTSKVIPHMDTQVNALGGIQGKNGPKYVDLSDMDKEILH